jgi:glutaredoxin
MAWRHWLKDRLIRRVRRFGSIPAAAPPAPVPVVLYTRMGCHLCDDALALLRKHQRRFFLQITEVDIDRDAVLMARYGDCVPVVVIGGRERFRGRVNEPLLVRQLKAERRG